MTTHPIIHCQGITKVFKDFWFRPRVEAVKGLDLEVRPREVFGLLGPNGSGKSTTIKMLLGLLYPTRGRIALFGQHPGEMTVKERIGYLPEESYLYRFLNARETLEYYGRLFRLDRRTRNSRIDMLLEMVGLEAVQRRPVGEYSKGMQRRIGLAQALINDPDLLILDEPTTGLDPLGTRQIKDLILMLRGRGKTVLLCSHLLEDVEDVCDRVTILYGGKCRALGTIEELLALTDQTVLESDRLDPQTLQRLRQVLEAEGKTLHRVANPRKKLETLFLEIVRQAQAEGAQTHGARADGRMAEFLAAGTTPPQGAEGAAVIEELLGAGQPPPPKPQPMPPATAAPLPPDPGVLAELTAETRIPAAAPPGPPLTAPPPSSTPGAGAPTNEPLLPARPPAPPNAAESNPQLDRKVLEDLL